MIAKLSNLTIDGRVAAGIAFGALMLTVLHAMDSLPAGLVRLDESLVPPFALWLDAMFNFIKDDLGLLVLTRTLTEGLETLLDASANIFYGKRRWPYIGPIPWAALAGVTAVVGYYLGGWRLALLGGGTFVWTALIGQWKLPCRPYRFLLCRYRWPLSLA